MTSLQTQFLETNGRPIKIGHEMVVQIDRIPIQSGVVWVVFVGGESEKPRGVALKSANGYVKLSNGKRSKLVYIWDGENLPKVVQHEVNCPDGILRVWNIYKVGNHSDPTEADAWTNNAGMIIENIAPHKRRYHCSDGLGKFDPKNLIFEIEWRSEKT